jgi:23S rRNA (cytosine1962-C5)-methyltransferase
MDQQYKSITLAKGREQSLQRFHPWVFSGGIKKTESGIKQGDIVKVFDASGAVLGVGHYQDGASIAVRVLSFEDVALDQNFWNARVANALAYRKNHLDLPNDKTNTFRLIHGEGDGLPGLIVDVYDTIAVIQCHSSGMSRSVDFISKAILSHTDNLIKYVYQKDSEVGSKVDDRWIGDSCPMPIKVVENGHSFLVNVVEGQKTGFFLDQRDNRNLVGSYSRCKSVLNLFCYTGGFSIYAINAGADNVVSVDVSKTAMEVVDANVALTYASQKHSSVCANVMEYLKNDSIPSYDIVIVDPPAFAKSLAKRHNAVQAYKRLNIQALGKVSKGGLMFTFSCSQVVGPQLFYDTIVAAAIEAGRKVRVIKHLSQGGDHPVNLFHPEGHYLKGLLLSVE